MRTRKRDIVAHMGNDCEIASMSLPTSNPMNEAFNWFEC